MSDHQRLVELLAASPLGVRLYDRIALGESGSLGTAEALSSTGWDRWREELQQAAERLKPQAQGR